MKKPRPPKPRYGAEPRYRFVLNPYTDARFTRCPRCEGLMKIRKIPLLIHVDPHHLWALRKTVKYCPGCDVLIVHKNELEQELAFAFQQRAPEAIGNDYLILGTVDVADWKRGLTEPGTPKEMIDRYHPFKEELEVKVTGGWMPAPERSPRKTATGRTR